MLDVVVTIELQLDSYLVEDAILKSVIQSHYIVFQNLEFSIAVGRRV